MPGGSRHAPKPRGAAGGGRSPQTAPRRTVKTAAAAGAASVDEARIADVIRPVIAAAGLDLEAVRVSAAGRRRLLRVVVDSDRGVSLDDAADVSRELSAALDAVAVMGDFPYTLEVSSPGVDRPLTEPRHWRRAAGRLVRATLAPRSAPRTDNPGRSATIEGRVLAAGPSGVLLEVAGEQREFSYAELGPGKILLEFTRAVTGADGGRSDGH